MAWNSITFNQELSSAAGTFNLAAVSELCGQLIKHLNETGDPYPSDDASAAMSILRRKRYFSLMMKVGAAFMMTGRASLKVIRLFAQAQIDDGDVAAGLITLHDLAAKAELLGHQGELNEARGLIGRAHKQYYVTTEGNAPHRLEHLKKSLKAYLEVYSTLPEKCLWHGINSVALLRRAERESVDCPVFVDPETIAKQIFSVISHLREPVEVWDCATAMEASLALGDLKNAGAWLERYVAHPDGDAFELASTLRQLEEVWQLDSAQGAGQLLLPVLRAHLLAKEGGAVDMSLSEMRKSAAVSPPQASDFEKVFGTDSYKALEWFRKGLRRARLVGRIGRTSTEGHGTGFVLLGKTLSPVWGESSILLTNSHVVSDNPEICKQGALHPSEVVVTFEALGNGEEYTVDLLWTSPPDKLDATVLLLKDTSKLAPLLTDDHAKIATGLPLLNDYARVYIIGHPQGGGLSYSLQDNLLLDHEDPLLHYRAPTDHGSSGSPVFNANWDFIGLHHKGSETMRRLNKKPGTYPANEAIWLQAVISELKTHPPAPPAST